MSPRRPPKGSSSSSKSLFRKSAAHSKYFRNRADKLWGQLIHRMYPECAVAGLEGYGHCAGTLEAHHLISRRRGHFRHLPEVGLGLCASHHRWGAECSPHMGPLGFAEFMREYRPEQYEWWLQNRYQIMKYDYREAITRLEDCHRALDEGFVPVWENGQLLFQ